SKGLGLIYVLVSIFFGSFLLAQVGDTFQRTIMPYVPIWVFLGSILILVAMLAWAGIEVFGRFTEIVWPVVLLSLIVTIIFLVQRFEWDQFYPILANGIKPITYGVWSCAPFGMEYVLFLAGVLSFLPREQENLKRLKTEVWRAIIMVGILDTLIALVQIMVFGPEESKRLNYGLLTLGKMVELGKALAGIESLFMLFWMGAMIIKIGAFYFTTLWGLRTVFGIKDELKWYLAISGIFLSLGYWAGKGPKFLEFITIMDQYIIFPFAIFWVSTIWGIAYWKQKRA
ncbi:MAG: GerAB/ArcD/ProY family transporter, partial [Desulfitobacterium hafniense]|nr:GerAB/ArcD/ProY family transporter [Desulfitobacterium hafniense]